MWKRDVAAGARRDRDGAGAPPRVGRGAGGRGGARLGAAGGVAVQSHARDLADLAKVLLELLR